MNIKNYLNKIVLIVILVLINTYANNTCYQRLTKNEKKQFIINYTDLLTAYSQHNFRGFKVHGELFINQYKNVLIDPKCEELREKYVKIEELSKTIDIAIQHNKFSDAMELLKRRTPNLKDLQLLDDYMTFLHENNLDTLFNKEMDYYNSAIENIYRINNKDISVYRILCEAAFVSDEFIQKESKKLEKGLEKEFLTISSQMNINEVRDFKNKNKEVYKDQILMLEENCRLRDRMKLLKKDLCIEDIKEYKSKYPQDDKYLYKKLQQKYARKIYRTKSLEIFTEYIELFEEHDDIYKYMEKVLVNRALSGSLRDGVAYLTIFPEGKYAFELEGYVKQLHTDMVNNSYGTDIDEQEIRY